MSRMEDHWYKVPRFLFNQESLMYLSFSLIHSDSKLFLRCKVRLRFIE